MGHSELDFSNKACSHGVRFDNAMQLELVSRRFVAADATNALYPYICTNESHDAAYRCDWHLDDGSAPGLRLLRAAEDTSGYFSTRCNRLFLRIHRLYLDAINRSVPLIDIAFNPLQELAPTLGARGEIGILDIEGANISSFPFRTNARLVDASGSPYCSLPLSQRTAMNVFAFLWIRMCSDG